MGKSTTMGKEVLSFSKTTLSLSTTMALLGEDGRGYELARRLESGGVWRSWLGDSLYAAFVHSLSSPATWEAFMSPDESKTRAQILLQLRARALLFDKASLSLSTPAPASAINCLSTNYLQLHGDDVYFTLEGCVPDGSQQGGVAANQTAISKARSKAPAGASFRYNEKEMDSISQRFRQEEFPESWYNQFFDKYRSAYRLPMGDPEMDKRSPEQMSTYLKVLEKHKRRRVAFREDETNHIENGSLRNPTPILNDNDDETYLFPETMFPLNCVPDSAISSINRVGKFFKVDSNGVLDTLPKMVTKSPIMIERLGIRPDYLKNGSEGNRKLRSHEQASEISKKVTARMLYNVGFQVSSEVPMGVLSQLLSCHIRKLGSTLKTLADSYRKECSAVELVKMFLQTTGHSNVGALAELVKNGARNSVQQTHQQLQVTRSQMQAHQLASFRQSQQIGRQMPSQFQQMDIQQLSQNLSFQQQQELEQQLRRHQVAPTSRPGMSTNMMNNMRPLLEVKLETPSEFPVDNNNKNNIGNNPYGAMNARQSQMQQQFRQHSLPTAAAVTNFRPQANNQYRQMASIQIPHSPSMSAGSVRAQPVKVEGFSELMGGGDSTLKHDTEDNKLTSPSK